MPKRHRGRPLEQTGQAPILKSEEIKRLFRLAKSRTRLSMKAEIALCLSLPWAYSERDCLSEVAIS